jgi:hypothetical protein
VSHGLLNLSAATAHRQRHGGKEDLRRAGYFARAPTANTIVIPGSMLGMARNAACNPSRTLPGEFRAGAASASLTLS